MVLIRFRAALDRYTGPEFVSGGAETGPVPDRS